MTIRTIRSFFLGFGIGITGLIAENLICHPFMILRRQCQVRNTRLKIYGEFWGTSRTPDLPVQYDYNSTRAVAVNSSDWFKSCNNWTCVKCTV